MCRSIRCLQGFRESAASPCTAAHQAGERTCGRWWWEQDRAARMGAFVSFHVRLARQGQPKVTAATSELLKDNPMNVIEHGRGEAAARSLSRRLETGDPHLP